MRMRRWVGATARTVSRSRSGAPRMQIAWIRILALALLLLVGGLAGCAVGGTVNGPTPAPTLSNNGTPTANSTLTLPSQTAGASATGPAGPGGAGEFCSKAPSVTVHPAANIPVYPGASLHSSLANGSNSFFGYCSSDTVSNIQNFYAMQLRAKGWTGLQTSTIATVIQISATQCAKPGAPQIVVTISPDATGSTTTSISIVLLAGAC